MNTFFVIMMGIAMLAVLGSLAIGVFGMARGGEWNRKYGNRMMRVRVAMQAVALLLFALAAVTYHR